MPKNVCPTKELRKQGILEPSFNENDCSKSVDNLAFDCSRCWLKITPSLVLCVHKAMLIFL